MEARGERQQSAANTCALLRRRACRSGGAEHLRGHVVGAAAAGAQRAGVADSFAEAKIDQLDAIALVAIRFVAVAVVDFIVGGRTICRGRLAEEHIFELDIAVADASCVEVGNGGQ